MSVRLADEVVHDLDAIPATAPRLDVPSGLVACEVNIAAADPPPSVEPMFDQFRRHT